MFYFQISKSIFSISLCIYNTWFYTFNVFDPAKSVTGRSWWLRIFRQKWSAGDYIFCSALYGPIRQCRLGVVRRQGNGCTFLHISLIKNFAAFFSIARLICTVRTRRWKNDSSPKTRKKRLTCRERKRSNTFFVKASQHMLTAPICTN